MKIAQSDKEAIIDKIMNTLLQEEKTKLKEDPKKLLVALYNAWYEKTIKPYQDSPLFKLLDQVETLEIKIELPIKTLSRTYYRTHIVNTIEASDTNYPLLRTNYYSYGGSTKIDTTKFPDIYRKIERNNAYITAVVTKLKEEEQRLRNALDTVNTYKQLETRLPVIFNSIPKGCADKYHNYQQRIKQRRKKEEIEVEDFSDLGTKLAIASLKKTD